MSIATVPGQSRFICFVQRQVRQIHEGGLSVLLRKVYKFLVIGLLAPVVLTERALGLLVVIRFGSLISHRIGHFAANTEVFLCERDAGVHGSRTRDIFYHTSPICNHQLKKMWDRTLCVWPSVFVYPLERLNRLVPGGEKHIVPMPHQDRDVHGLLASTPPHLSFTPDEEQTGRAGLKDLGVPEGTSFVCFHARDSAYLETIYPNLALSYHDYRDSNIHNYLPAAEELTQRGYYAIRMGAVVKEALNVSNPRIIDYAVNGSRTDFMDVFLGAKCTFFISSGTGIDAIPMIFRRLSVFVNFVPLEYGRFWQPGHLFIPKKHWLREEHRFMTFREILDSGAGRFLRSEQFEQCDIELIENTPEEIEALAVEMDERLNGTWQTTEKDEVLQHRFWSLFKPSELNGVFRARIGAEFLRQNRELLD